MERFATGNNVGVMNMFGWKLIKESEMKKSDEVIKLEADLAMVNQQITVFKTECQELFTENVKLRKQLGMK